MSLSRRLAHPAVTTLLLGLYGCCATMDSIPAGEWNGEGEWYIRQRNEKGQWKRIGGKYTVAVAVTKHEVKGRKLLAIQVHSKHPKNSPFETENVQVLIGLTNCSPASDGSLLCNTYTRFSIEDPLVTGDTIEDNLKSLLDDEPSPPARLVRFGQGNTIEVRYTPRMDEEPLDFVEAFTFAGDRLVKKGRYGSVDANGGMLSWTENLHKNE